MSRILTKNLKKKIKIGIPSDYLKDVSQDILNQIENAKKVLSQHGIEFIDVEFTTTEYDGGTSDHRAYPGTRVNTG